MDREQILEVIRRSAEANGGVLLGTDRLAALGVTPAVWGRYFARIGDAQRAAGFDPNTMQPSYSDEEVLGKLAAFARELGAFPTVRDMKWGQVFNLDFCPENAKTAKVKT